MKDPDRAFMSDQASTWSRNITWTILKLINELELMQAVHSPQTLPLCTAGSWANTATTISKLFAWTKID